MCEYCEPNKNGEIRGKSFKLEKTVAYMNTYINKDCWILKGEGDEKAGIMVADRYPGVSENALYFDINYCPICGRKLY